MRKEVYLITNENIAGYQGNDIVIHLLATNGSEYVSALYSRKRVHTLADLKEIAEDFGTLVNASAAYNKAREIQPTTRPLFFRVGFTA